MPEIIYITARGCIAADDAGRQSDPQPTEAEAIDQLHSRQTHAQ